MCTFLTNDKGIADQSSFIRVSLFSFRHLVLDSGLLVVVHGEALELDRTDVYCLGSLCLWILGLKNNHRGGHILHFFLSKITINRHPPSPVADPGFPRGGGANSLGGGRGAPTYNFAQISPKLHLDARGGGGRVPHAPPPPTKSANDLPKCWAKKPKATTVVTITSQQ